MILDSGFNIYYLNNLVFVHHHLEAEQSWCWITQHAGGLSVNINYYNTNVVWTALFNSHSEVSVTIPVHYIMVRVLHLLFHNDARLKSCFEC